MKKWLGRELRVLNYITSTEKYKIIFSCSIILSLYGTLVLGLSTDNFFNSFLIPFRFSTFNLLLFALLFLNNMNACSIFKNDFSFYIIRLKNKREFVKEMLKVSTMMYFFQISIIFLFLIMILLLTKAGNLEIYPYQNFYNIYEVNNLVYCLFYFVRYIILGLLIMIISTLIYLNTNGRTVLLFNGFFLLLQFYFNDIVLVNPNFTINLFLYFSASSFNSFMIEVSSSLLMIIVLEIIIMLFKFITRENRWVDVS